MPSRLWPQPWPRTTLDRRLRFGDAGNLAQAGQRIELAKEGDHRATVADLADKGGGYFGEPARHAKPVLLQHGDLGGSRLLFMKAQFRMAPDRAWVDLRARRERGEQVDSKNIKKHEGDILRLSQLLSDDDRFEIPELTREHLKQFLETVEDRSKRDLADIGVSDTMDKVKAVLSSVFLTKAEV